MDKQEIIKGLERGISAMIELTEVCHNISGGDLDYYAFRDRRIVDLKNAIAYIKERD